MISFNKFFSALHGRPPFAWQTRLADEVARDGWPDTIDLPTASGKTACLEVAMYEIARTGHGPRRIFYVVDRRVVVNAAYERTKTIAEKLKMAVDGELRAVADALRMAGGDSFEPLRVVELRGGIYRDPSWIASPLQPTIIATTVDQVGSRLLFRGYGESPSTQPIHAAMVANDSLVLLDEAHCSRAFSQTMSAIEKYRAEWSSEGLNLPFRYVEMTATPSRSSGRVFRLSDDDRTGPLRKRILAPKPVLLQKADKPAKLAALAQNSATGNVKRVAVMVNRVAAAREIADELARRGSSVELLIGRMRPLDRDDQLARLEPLRSGTPRQATEPASFIVSTQTLEVGADLDFDAIVSECASIDSLLQRFGRLDRLGELEGAARGAVVALGTVSDNDPVYGGSLLKTWNWLESLSAQGPLNFGIASANGQQPTIAEVLRSNEPEGLRRLGPAAPVLLPSHLDTLVQTSPRPHVEPDVALFLHGPDAGPADVNVVWRSDLSTDSLSNWVETVSLLPPMAAEAMPARLWDVKRWMRRDSRDAKGEPDADLEGLLMRDDRDRKQPPGTRHVLVWQGEDTVAPTNDPESIYPGATILIPAADQDWKMLGHIPDSGLVDGVPRDWADRAAWAYRRRPVLRLDNPAQGGDLDWETHIQPALARLIEQGDLPPWRREIAQLLIDAGERKCEPIAYRDGDRILITLRTMRTADEEAGGDELSGGAEVTLPDHLLHVAQEASRLAAALVPNHQSAVKQAAEWHDAGKADLRFQTLLRNGDRLAAEYSPVLLAKSAGPTVNGRSAVSAVIPRGFRHEQLSLLLADKALDREPDRDLILHLIASHHGRCRPFAAVVVDPDPPPVSFHALHLTTREQQQRSASRLDSGVARRFWRLTRRFGWWGLPYLEAMLRLADWEASRKERAKQYD